MRVALISLDQAWQDKAHNSARCKEHIANAARKGCQLIIFPEMTLTGYSLKVSEIAEDVGHSETIKFFSMLSSQYQIDIVFGLCLRRNKNGQNIVFNVLGHASQNGQVSTCYAKFHPFTFSGEDEVIAPGEDLGFIKISGLTLGASICYDLRFPLLFAIMAPQISGAICIANWPAKRVAHWRALLVARAIENQMYMIGVNRIGTDGNALIYEKSSIVVLPDGQVMSPLLNSYELDIYDLDFDAALKYRTEFPTLRDANFSRYAQLIGQLSERENEDGNA